jgi:broad specificity phosphatase PhoE
MKRLILIRHGQTQKGKNEPERTLTIEGEDAIAEAAFAMRKYILGSVAILHSPTLRTRQSANIIGEVIGCEDIQKADLRVNGVELVAARANASKIFGIPEAAIYMQKVQSLNLEIETPEQTYLRFKEIFNSINAQTIIAVSHEPAIRIFLDRVQGLNIIFKSFQHVCGFADFIVIDNQA